VLDFKNKSLDIPREAAGWLQFKFNMKTLIFLIALTISTAANASCFCACIDGVNQPVCTGALNIEPICPPAICN